MAIGNVKVNLVLNINSAIRDPFFWADLLINKATFGRVDMGRWRKYVKLEDVNG